MPNVPTPEGHYAVVELSFSSSAVDYSLAFEDYPAREWVPLTNPNDTVASHKDQPYVFHVRAGAFGPFYDLPVAAGLPVR